MSSEEEEEEEESDEEFTMQVLVIMLKLCTRQSHRRVMCSERGEHAVKEWTCSSYALLGRAQRWVVSGSSTPDSSTPSSSTIFALQLLITSHKHFRGVLGAEPPILVFSLRIWSLVSQKYDVLVCRQIASRPNGSRWIGCKAQRLIVVCSCVCQSTESSAKQLGAGRWVSVL